MKYSNLIGFFCDQYQSLYVFVGIYYNNLTFTNIDTTSLVIQFIVKTESYRFIWRTNIVNIRHWIPKYIKCNIKNKNKFCRNQVRKHRANGESQNCPKVHDFLFCALPSIIFCCLVRHWTNDILIHNNMFCSSALLLCTCSVSSNNSIAHKGITEIVLQEKFEDINGVIRAVNRRRAYNTVAKRNRTNNVLQSPTQKTAQWAIQIPLKTEMKVTLNILNYKLYWYSVIMYMLPVM
jgi:hypothetical protein